MTRVTILTNDILLATTHVEGSNMAEDGLLHELVQNKPDQFFNDDGTYMYFPPHLVLKSSSSNEDYL